MILALLSRLDLRQNLLVVGATDRLKAVLVDGIDGDVLTMAVLLCIRTLLAVFAIQEIGRRPILRRAHVVLPLAVVVEHVVASGHA